MKKKTKIVLAVLATAAVGGAVWYVRKKKKVIPVFADTTTHVKTSSVPLPKAIEDIVYKGSFTKPASTEPAVVSPQIVSEPVYSKPLIQSAPPILEPVAKVYPTIQPVTSYIAKDYYLQQREAALAGLFF